MSLFVIILNWNGKEDTLECLKSLAAVPTPHRLVIVDNGSTDGSASTFREQFPHAVVLENRENLGYAEGNNVGIRYALKQGAEHLVILNNDTVVDPGFLDAFLQTAEQHLEATILGAKPFLYGDRSRLDHLGGMWNGTKGVFDLIGFREEGSQWNLLRPLDYVCGCALFASAEVFRKVGEFDPRFFLFWEESDWCFRARNLGFYSYFCPDAKLWHKVSASFTGGKAHVTYFWWRNRLFWIKRNCSKAEQRRLFFKVLLPEILHFLKLYPLKKMQLLLRKYFRAKAGHEKRKKQLLSYKAALSGVRDYFFSRFGNGPPWIWRK